MQDIRSGAAALACALLVAAAAGAAQKPPVNTTRAGLALRGYDAVAYWSDGKPALGNARYEHQWNGAVWRFTSAANRDRFAAAPERFAPRFGGYCAYAVSQGYTADGDPAVWRIVDGRLYLNYSRHAERLWTRDVPGNIERGNRNWPRVLEP